MFDFEELDETTRKYMLSEFRAEEASGSPYRGRLLSSTGLAVFPQLMEDAIENGNEVTLADSLSNPAYWQPTETRVRRGKAYVAQITPEKVAERLAIGEFNTWYVRGFARRLMEEGEEYCQVYRAAPAWEPRGECLEHEGRIYRVQDIYDGHRARYWPDSNPDAFSIPVGPNCHHSIRRVRD